MTTLTDTFATSVDTIHSADPTTVVSVDLSRLSSTALKISRNWIDAETVRASRVHRYRRYYDGDHDAGLNEFMRALLRIKDNDDGFTLNMMPSVVDTMANRCIVQSIEAVKDKLKEAIQAAQMPDMPELAESDPHLNPSAFIQEVMEYNRFDILQGQTHAAAIRDGDAFVMVSWDNDEKCAKWTFEEAFDGSTGMLAYYKSRNLSEMTAAIKVWQEESSENAEQAITRVNVYFPDRVEKYRAVGQGAFEPHFDEGDTPESLKWTDRKGQPLGIPVIHFANGGRHNYGASELRNAISVQNALNRSNTSAVMIAELTAFSILVARGHQPPSGAIVPGMIYQIGNSPLEGGQVADLTRLGGGDIAPILSMIDKERQLIADITRTPSAQLLGGSGTPSGEYLKQLEIGLLGKVRNFQTHAGAAWETVADMTWKVQAAFGDYVPPEYKRFRTLWRSAEIRNNTEIVTNAVSMTPIWGDRQTLRAVQDVYDLDENKIEEIMRDKQERAATMPAQVDPNAQSVTGGALPKPDGNIGGNSSKELIPPVTGDIVSMPTNEMNPTPIKGASRQKPFPPISDAELAKIFQLHSMMMSK